MQNTPITLAERFTAFGVVAVLALTVFGIATILHTAISKNDRRKRIQGQPIRWWVTGLYAIGAISGTIIADNQHNYMHEVVGGLGGFGILAGLLIGNIHGGINLFVTPTSSDLSDSDSSVSPPETLVPPVHDNVNPYKPPKHQ